MDFTGPTCEGCRGIATKKEGNMGVAIFHGKVNSPTPPWCFDNKDYLKSIIK